MLFRSMLQEIIVSLQSENKITICICDHQARDLLACVDLAMILSNGKIIAQDTPSNLVNNRSAKSKFFIFYLSKDLLNK